MHKHCLCVFFSPQYSAPKWISASKLQHLSLDLSDLHDRKFINVDLADIELRINRFFFKRSQKYLKVQVSKGLNIDFHEGLSGNTPVYLSIQ